MTFAEYWAENEPFGCNPEEVAELAWNAAIAMQRERLEEAQYVGQKALEHASRLEERLEKCEAAALAVLESEHAMEDELFHDGDCPACAAEKRLRAALGE